LDGQVLIASIKNKMHAISPEVMEGLMEAVELAEQEYQGMVIWSGDAPFSVGADLEATMPAFVVGGADAIESIEQELQNLMLRIRYAQVPVVAAIHGMALGGGCELAVHCARRVAHMESYIGLVEVGVGLVPGAGGLTYIARRAAEAATRSTGKDLLPFLTEGFTAAAMAKVGTSAIESRQLGYLLDSDLIVPHKDELLYVAINEARAMAAGGWRAPLPRPFPVAGRSGKATIMGSLVNMQGGGFISEFDQHIATLIANVVCGGDVDAGTLVDEAYLLKLERQAFCHLIAHPKTHERILGMLNTGKPVRN
ncbi:MAG TPA: enoyl-CoA hydratase/isomerase family protein, partial [Ottowia sp.]|nr:enoyl-CoA hydratase/isomerase family protein [Ottowia sp.]